MSEIKDIIDRNVTLQFETTSRNPTGKRDDWGQRLMQTHKQIHGLWAPNAPDLSVPDGAAMSSAKCVNTEGSVPASVNAAPDSSKSPSASSKANRGKEARASLLYKGLTTAKARGWLLRLTTSAPNTIVPSDEQRLALQDVMDGCLQERNDEQQELDIRSEPSLLFLHGVPGAGKSKLL